VVRKERKENCRRGGKKVSRGGGEGGSILLKKERKKESYGAKERGHEETGSTLKEWRDVRKSFQRLQGKF